MIAVVAVGGVAFASFTSSVTVHANASAGTIVLKFDGTNSGSSTPSGATCTIAFPSSPPTQVATVTASNLAPGQYCTFNLEIANYGTLPATTESTVLSPTGGTICNSAALTTNCIFVQDNLGLNSETPIGGSGSTTIPAGGTFPYILYATLPSGSTDQTTHASFDITFTGSD